MLVVSHVYGWRSVDKIALEPAEASYFRRQLRRRLITSACIGLLGGIILALHWVRSPTVFTIAVLALGVLVSLILWMALIDLVSSRRFLQDLNVSQRVRRAELEAEVEKLRKSQRTGEENGKNAHG